MKYLALFSLLLSFNFAAHAVSPTYRPVNDAGPITSINFHRCGGSQCGVTGYLHAGGKYFPFNGVVMNREAGTRRDNGIWQGRLDIVATYPLILGGSFNCQFDMKLTVQDLVDSLQVSYEVPVVIPLAPAPYLCPGQPDSRTWGPYLFY